MKVEVTQSGAHGKDGKEILVGTVLDVGEKIPGYLAGKCRPVQNIGGGKFIANPNKKGTVITIIESLSPEDFTADGKPQVEAINLLLPEGYAPVTAKERDEIHAAMNKL